MTGGNNKKTYVAPHERGNQTNNVSGSASVSGVGSSSSSSNRPSSLSSASLPAPTTTHDPSPQVPHTGNNNFRSTNGKDTRRVNKGRGGGGRGGGGRGGGNNNNNNNNSGGKNAKKQGQFRNNNNNNQRSTHRKDKSPLPSFETSDFQKNFHAKLCRAAKYKVHAPNCSCPKVVKLREAYNVDTAAAARNKTSSSSSSSNTSSLGRMMTAMNNVEHENAYSNEAVQYDVDGNFSQQLSQLNLTSNGGGPEMKDNSIDTINPFDNLIVISDTKSMPAIYVCNNTNAQTFQTNGTTCEKKMATEIFGQDTATTDKLNNGIDSTIPPFKVSCAICLLTTHQRNGFVAIVSHSLEMMHPTIERARDAVSDKVQRNGKEGLHADHAHYVCAIRVSSLLALLSAGKTRSKDLKFTMKVLAQMQDGGVDLPTGTLECMTLSSSSTSHGNAASSIQIKMGHHLTSLLWLLEKNPSSNKHSKNKHHNIDHTNPQYVMVMGYIDGPTSFELDLPGGKRHLGESTLQGAIREVEEECSLKIDPKWFASNVSKEFGGVQAATPSYGAGEDGDGSVVRVLVPRKVRGNESGDAFFVMTPPPI